MCFEIRLNAKPENVTINFGQLNNYNAMTMIKTYLSLILIILVNVALFGQVTNGQLIEEKVKYQYDDKKPNETYAPKIQLGKEIQINFDCCFKDTVQIYVNDKLIDKLFLDTNESTSFTGHSITVKFDEENTSTTLKVVLPNKQVYCNIVLDKKYRILNVNRMEHWDKTWWITFRNYGIRYE